MTTNNLNLNIKNGVNVTLNASIVGTLTAGAIVGGNAVSSTKWASPITLTHTGDISGVGSFDGSSPATIAMTLAASGVVAGTYTQVVVDTTGLVTSGSNSSINPDVTGALKTSMVNLTSSGYLPLSSSTLTNTYNAVTYPALASLCGIIYGSPNSSQITLPNNNSWQAIAWGGSLFVAVIYGSNIAASSPDGINWTPRTLSASANWYSICWGGSLFVAIAYGSTIAASSPDGITWTSRSLPVSAGWSSIVWGGSLFVALASSSAIAASSLNGINWTQRTMPVSANWIDVAWGGSLFVAVVTSSTVAASSLDGATWTQRTMPVSSGWEAVAWGGSLFVAVTVGIGSTVSATSFDGVTWTQRTLPIGANWYSIAWNGSFFVSIGAYTTNVISSPDGIKWATGTFSNQSWQSVASNGSVFVAVASSTSMGVTITISPNRFTTPTFTGSMGIAGSNYYIKT